ncbi:hypothetical protein EZS27_014068 [termite gut metagenome]|uniref:Uncharacterized protein n=1 Tax=termite gut metagenome TaxID=433724 RepID=A0A5J4RWB7_9ZZZZ
MKFFNKVFVNLIFFVYICHDKNQVVSETYLSYYCLLPKLFNNIH